jgi:hypothetical protein
MRKKRNKRKMKAPKPDHSSLRALSAAVLASFLITNPLTAPPASTAGTSLYIPSMQEYDEALRVSKAQLQKCIASRRINGIIMIDGILTEIDWSLAPVSTGFIQREPDDGEPSAEKTYFRVLYDDEYIYIGITALDSQPDKIVGRLTRRDNYTPSDWLAIAFDSYDDKRTAFEFQVNPAGVKRDRFWFDDNEHDENWDAVWQVGTHIDENGWTAEFRIPFNQLRYSGNGHTQSWGLQVYRTINRLNELSYWNRCPRESSQIVSVFGRLEGMEDLPVTRNLEILPYMVGSLESYGEPGDDPYLQNTIKDGRIGSDLMYGLTSDITLNVTLNPDFGQVEQDPSEFNLTAYETYFHERRPFFVEGANIFASSLSLGDMDRERLFYSRRIGRRPHGYALDSERLPEDTDDGYWVDGPEFTTILGAAKVTGKTAGGWSIGILDALTDKEESVVRDPNGREYGIAVEPMTNYAVLSIQKDFNEGRTNVGGIGTSVHRKLPAIDFNYLVDQAYSGGLRLNHRWTNEDYQITGKLYRSYIKGSEEAILEAQTSPIRYFQRPDAEHLGIDSTLTSLAGWSSTLWGGKFGGQPWRWGAGVHIRSPGFEINDVGFSHDADEFFPVVWAGYRKFEEQWIFREYSINSNLWNGTNFGWENLGRVGGNINGWGQFKNYWSMFGGINRNMSRQDNRLLRGGPSVLVPGRTHSWYGFSTDNRKAVVFRYSGSYGADDEGFGSYSIEPGITIRPSSRFDITLSPEYYARENDRQYVDEIAGNYIVANLKRETLFITTRFNLTITPEMTLQFYGMPYITAGRYSDYREVVAPHASNYDDRFAPYDYSDNLDFNFKEFNSNLVFRWEYSPGSTLFLVWSRGASDYEEEYGRFDAGRDLGNLFSSPGDNTFLVKINKWFSL